MHAERQQDTDKLITQASFIQRHSFLLVTRIHQENTNCFSGFFVLWGLNSAPSTQQASVPLTHIHSTLASRLTQAGLSAFHDSANTT